MKSIFKGIKKYFLFIKINKFLKTTNEDILFIVKLYSVITYLDLKVKDIEIINSFDLIDKYIKLKFRKLQLEHIHNIQEYAKIIYYENIRDFRNDKGSYELYKQEILSVLRKIKNKKLYKNILLIINSDNIITDKENEFLIEMQKIYKGN
ncbi:hypothetical protein [Aliarcobacter butzleri]|uniref:hypothetical protein n=1 Tax=Aliarcobacter butzleri TaxID=28197 RepID=UPI002B24B905|nr:hypothetical protein [Aliarcobacter butzleri]